MLELKAIVNGFFKFAETTGVEIYNEFSLQHEMGIYLRSVLSDYKVQFERNVSFFTTDCCCSPFLSLPCPRHLPKTAPMFCRITA